VRGGHARSFAAAAGLLAAFACARPPEADPLYRPTQNVLEVVAVLRLHVDDDTYRFRPARDYTGKNVYSASLRRLESLEEIHEEKFKSGYLVDVIWFAKGRALERLTEYDLAAKHYSRVGDLDSPLRDDARRARPICQRLAAAASLHPGSGASVEDAMGLFDERARALEELAREVDGTHYAIVAREEIERGDRERADYFRARRRLEHGLDTLAVQQYQRLVQSHPQSKLRNRHLLDLGDLYSELARDYTLRVNPASLDFDPAAFDEYAFGASRVYGAVAQQDGVIEKIEAARKLEAFLAFTLQVHDEKLPRP
jgi:tetratricopeptide (TPR) repeat protein